MLANFINENPLSSLAIIQGNKLLGFANFEVLHGEMPHDYVGSVENKGKALFIQQFTTVTNYKCIDMSADELLLSAIEQKAKELDCNEVWEALSIEHPYRKENNAVFDAFGFYESKGYVADIDQKITWEPDTKTSIERFLFRKKILS